MPSNLVSQIATLVNTIPKTNDPVAGGTYTGTGAADYPSQVGSRMVLGNDDVQIKNQTTLFGGEYQYVQMYSSVTSTPAVGLIAFWQSDTSYVVTTDEPTGVSDIAGVLVSAVTKGNYGWVQIEGKVNVAFRATIGKATPAIGDYVTCAALGAGADNAKADVVADSTTYTTVIARHFLGIAVTAPTSGASSPVRLSFSRKNF